MSAFSLWDENGPEQTFHRVRIRSGRFYVYADPPLPGRKPTDPVRQDHPLLLKWMGENGHTTVEEIPLSRDDAQGACPRCGHVGEEWHHWAPKEYFGTDTAEDWPQGDICAECHRAWHERMNAWADAVDLLTTNEDDPVNRRPARALTERQRERASEVIETLGKIGHSGNGKVSDGAKYLAFRVKRLLDATEHETAKEERKPQRRRVAHPTP